MVFPDRDGFFSKAAQSLSEMYDELTSLPDVDLLSLNPKETALIVVDIVNGFAKEGALASPRIGAIVSPIASLVSKCLASGIPVVAFADTHTTQSAELSAYPPHCLRGTEEAELCSGITESAGPYDTDIFTKIEKNSTNGFVEPMFDIWMQNNAHITTYIVVGDCTDICISQFALTAKAWHNTRDLPLRALVPFSLCDTFDAPNHPADLMNVFSLLSMKSNGVEICRNILF